MNALVPHRHLIAVGFLSFAIATCAQDTPKQTATPPRETILFDAGWKFALGHATDKGKDFEYGRSIPLAKRGEDRGATMYGAISQKFNDTLWRTVDLPHDWANELPFINDPRYYPTMPTWVSEHGFKPVGPYFPETSVGWYRKTFTALKSDEGRRTSLVFDGAYRDTEVWLNCHRIGRHEGGYTGFRFDITDYLNYGGNNVLVLRVDASKYEGWFYEGAGLYRHAWIEKTSPVHVTPHGLRIVADGTGKVAASVSVIAAGGVEPKPLEACVRILDGEGREIAKASQPLGVAANAKLPDLTIPSPKLWSVETPNLYRYELELRQNGSPIDRISSTFGVRTLRFDPEQGFFLNGMHLFVKGVCMHQDAAGVGVAVPDALLEWRLKELKKWGFNAYRTSHHAPAPELLDLCDKLGILVMDENRSIGSCDDILRDLRYLVERDRNHPSVIMWSLGNEEGTVQSSAVGARLAASMKRLVSELDVTRPVTYGNNGGESDTGIMSQLDLYGINYTQLGHNFDKLHKKHPRLPMIATEEASTLCTRGIYAKDAARGYMSAYDIGFPGWGKSAEGWVRDFAARPWLSGAFIWTGFDYRGEPNPYTWPCISSHFGVLDTCGFPKDNAWYYKVWWTDEPVLHVFPHWNWAGQEGKEIDVRCFSNHDEVELFLNDVSLGRKPMPRLGHIAWKVKYTPGKLTAKGYRQGKVVQETEVATTGEPAAIVAEPAKTVLTAGGQDCVVINVAVNDAQGRVVPTAAVPVSFLASANARILGVGNGDPSCHEPDLCLPQAGKPADWKRTTFNGWCQVIVAAPKQPGEFTVQFTAPGLKPTELKFKVE